MVILFNNLCTEDEFTPEEFSNRYDSSDVVLEYHGQIENELHIYFETI